MQYGIHNYEIQEVTVNEQGNQYPLLYMKRG